VSVFLDVYAMRPSAKRLVGAQSSSENLPLSIRGGARPPYWLIADLPRKQPRLVGALE
jgi:hypothetical protein